MKKQSAPVPDGVLYQLGTNYVMAPTEPPPALIFRALAAGMLARIQAEKQRAPLEPAMRERADQIAAEARPIATKPNPTRADLHALLDACLDLADCDDPQKRGVTIWDGNDTPQKEHGREIGMALLRGAVGWTEGDVHSDTYQSLVSASQRHDSSQPSSNPRPWATVVARLLERSPHLLPAEMMAALVSNLKSLNDGSGRPPALLTPRDKDGKHGPNPTAARASELRMLRWIEYIDVHSTKRVQRTSAQNDVARACGVSTEAVEAWSTAAKKEFAVMGSPDTEPGWRVFVADDVRAGQAV